MDETIERAPQGDQTGTATLLDLETARKRRQGAKECVDQRDTLLAKMQERYIILAEPAGIFDMEEQRLNKEQGFKLRHRMPKFSTEEGGHPKSIGQIFLDHPNTQRCSYLTFRPGKPPIDGDHLNLWRAPDIKPVPGDPKPFLEHLDYIYDGVKEAIEFTLNWMALPMQKPGTKMESAILITGEEGTGKSLIGDVLRKLHGYENTVKIKGEELESQFTDYLQRATIMVVEEVCLKGKWVLMDRIKDLITSNKTRINIKHISPYEIDNVTNIVMNSNHSNALVISKGDRRWHPHISHKPPQEPAYYERLFNWLEREHGYEIIYDYLLKRNLGDFTRHSKPPMTQCKLDLIHESRSGVEQAISDAIEDREGIFASDLVTEDQVLGGFSNSSEGRARRDIRHAMNRLCSNTGRRIRVKLTPTVNDLIHNEIYKGDPCNKKWRLWPVRDHARWRMADPEEMRAELKKAHPDIILD